jgi:hypothetical protein
MRQRRAASRYALVMACMVLLAWPSVQANAADVFRSLGLPVQETVRIEVGAAFPPQSSPSAVGCFVESDRRVPSPTDTKRLGSASSPTQ